MIPTGIYLFKCLACKRVALTKKERKKTNATWRLTPTLGWIPNSFRLLAFSALRRLQCSSSHRLYLMHLLGKHSCVWDTTSLLWLKSDPVSKTFSAGLVLVGIFLLTHRRAQKGQHECDQENSPKHLDVIDRLIFKYWTGRTLLSWMNSTVCETEADALPAFASHVAQLVLVPRVPSPSTRAAGGWAVWKLFI